jgi:secernin
MVTIGDAGVLFAKNSDRDPNESQRVEWHSAADHPHGERISCTWIDIDQVTHTNAVLLSRPWWMWGAEIGANEHGVVIGNEAVFTNEPYEDVGLLGMDLLRLALERASNATDAVQMLVTLLEAHGQGGSCSMDRPKFTYHNSFIVADPTSAFVLETAGRKWATETVAPGSARSVSNGLTIAGFAEAHADRLKTRVSACAARRAITEAAADRASGPIDLMTTLRSHGPNAHPHYSVVNGGLGVPCVHGGGLVASSQTTASWVADLRGADHRGADHPGARTGAAALHWVTGTSAPCTSIFKPARVDEPVDLGPTGDDRDDRYDPANGWWRHEPLHRLVDRDPASLLPRYRAERDAVERAWVDDPPSSVDAFEQADALERRWLADVAKLPVRDRRPPFVRRAWKRWDRDAGMASLTTSRHDTKASAADD